MKKFRTLFLVSIMLLCFMPSKVRASHCAGAELIYQWVKDSTYRIYYKFYRDCAGIQESPTVGLCMKSTCDPGYPASVGAPIDMNEVSGILSNGLPNGSEVQKQCPGTYTTCNNPPGIIPGYREWWYAVVVTLPYKCDHWEFSVTQSARNAAITNLDNPGAASLWVDATLDNADFQGDTSPYFSVKPVPYVCDNAPYTYNNGAVDINNDSMYFQLGFPSGSGACTDTFGGNIVPFVTLGIPGPAGLYPFNLFNNPLQCNNTFTLNRRNGSLSFTPSGAQIAVVNLLCQSYRSGVLIGHVMRDIQIVVRECPNQQPVVNVNTTTITGGQLDNNGNITTCAGNHFFFTFQATSADTNAKLAVADNHNDVAPTATVTYTNYATDTVTGVFDWTPTALDTGFKVLAITVSDSSCRPPGIIISQTFTLPMFILPQTHAFHDTSICDGDTVHLLVVGGSTFNWTAPNGSGPGSINCPTCNNPVVTPHLTTDYIVTSDLNSVCKNTDTAHIAVTPALLVTVSPDTTTCVGDSLQLSASVTPPPGVSYRSMWGPAGTISNPTDLTTYVKPSITTAYSITVVPIGGLGQCTKIDTVHVKVLQGFTLFNHDTAMCVNDSFAINLAGENNYTYTWSPAVGVSDIHSKTPEISPDTSRTYTVTASYPGCTDSVASVHVDMQAYPEVTAGPDRIICSGDTVQLRGFATPKNSTYTYNWVPAAAVDTPTKANAVFKALITTSMTLNVSTSAGCTGSGSLTITVIKNEFLQVSNDTSICPHAVIKLGVSSVSGDMLQSFYWEKSDYLGDVTSDSPSVYPVTTTSFTVYGVDTTLCRDTATIYVSVKPEATISLPDTVILYPGQTYQMNPLTNCNSFTWYPALGLDTNNISNPVASPTVNTRYFVTGITEGGCVAYDTIEVLIAPDSYVNIANAFAPGHGPNTVLKVLHLGNATLQSFVIYNRWGIKVFESHDINEGWDGTLNGQPQPMGVYIYTVEAKSYEGRSFIKQGNVTLLR